VSFLSSGNDISGTIPDFLFSHKSLKVLDLHANILTGSIPSVDVEINDTFEFLALYENDLSDRVPSSISSLISLRHMDLSKNSLIGNLPASIATMKNLKYLFIGNNEFSDGTIPGFLTEMEFLEELSIWDTNLKGVIPEKFGDLSNLVYLDLSKNQLVGSIPENFGMLTHLEYLLMRDNVLTGTLPSGLGNLNISEHDLCVCDFILYLCLTKLLSIFAEVLLLEANEFTGDANMICQSNLSYFGSDCGGSQPEIQCNCCTIWLVLVISLSEKIRFSSNSLTLTLHPYT
jgi:Leucine-rich repeat (LRR) protein